MGVLLSKSTKIVSESTKNDVFKPLMHDYFWKMITFTADFYMNNDKKRDKKR